MVLRGEVSTASCIQICLFVIGYSRLISLNQATLYGVAAGRFPKSPIVPTSRAQIEFLLNFIRSENFALVFDQSRTRSKYKIVPM